MAAKELKKAADNLACSVCYQVFKNPKYLPCYHSFCEECLDKIQKESKITCPECRQEATVPTGGVKALPNNFLINRLVDELIIKRKVDGEEEVQCDRCEEADPVVSFCLDCGGEFLCHFCHESHKRDKRSRGHKILPLAELRSNKDALQIKAKIPPCKEHDYELKHYCETCDQLVCLYCTMKAHSNHSHDTVKNMAEKHRNELEKITAPIHKMIEGLAEAHDNTDKMGKDLKQRGSEVDKEIDQYYDGLVQKLMEQKQQTKQQLHDTLSQIEKAISMQLEEIEFTQGEVSSVKELKDRLEKSSDEEALSAKKQMITCMKQLSGKYDEWNISMQCTKIKLITTQNAFPQFSQLEIIRGLKCHSHGCQRLGLESQNGYCSGCFKSYDSKTDCKHSKWKEFDPLAYKQKQACDPPADDLPAKSSDGILKRLAAAIDSSERLKCHSHGCQRQGLKHTNGYCRICYLNITIKKW